MWGHPGKKLLFMGQEFGQRQEWNFAWQLDWHLLEQPFHAGVQSCVRDLNAVYRREISLHAGDCEAAGFRWIVADDADQSVLAWLRLGRASDPPVVAVSNFTPVPRYDYRIGVPRATGPKFSTPTARSTAVRGSAISARSPPPPSRRTGSRHRWR